MIHLEYLFQKNIKQEQKRDNVKVVYNTNQYQHIRSLLCGYFCIYFLNEMNKGKYIKKMKSYCVKQKIVTECVEPSGYKTAKNGRAMFWCTCAECGIKKNKICFKKWKRADTRKKQSF